MRILLLIAQVHLCQCTVYAVLSSSVRCVCAALSANAACGYVRGLRGTELEHFYGTERECLCGVCAAPGASAGLVCAIACVVCAALSPRSGAASRCASTARCAGTQCWTAGIHRRGWRACNSKGGVEAHRCGAGSHGGHRRAGAPVSTLAPSPCYLVGESVQFLAQPRCCFGWLGGRVCAHLSTWTA